MSPYPVRRNTLLLSAALACLSGQIQLSVAIATTTLVLVTGVEGILGLGPAVFLATGASKADAVRRGEVGRRTVAFPLRCSLNPSHSP